MKSVDEDDFRDFVATKSGELMRRAYVLTGGDQHGAEDLVRAVLATAADRWREKPDRDLALGQRNTGGGTSRRAHRSQD